MKRFVYHPPTVDSIRIERSPDRLGVVIGVYSSRNGGKYAAIDIPDPDIEKIIQALREAQGPYSMKDDG